MGLEAVYHNKGVVSRAWRVCTRYEAGEQGERGDNVKSWTPHARATRPKRLCALRFVVRLYARRGGSPAPPARPRAASSLGTP